MKPRGPSILASCLTGCLGGVILIVVAVIFSTQALGIIKGATTYTAPGSWSIQIRNTGLVTIFADEGSSQPVAAANITVESPSHVPVSVNSFAQNVNSTITVGTTTYTGIASFSAATPGQYHVQVIGATGRMLFIPGIGKQLIGNTLLSFLGIIIGVLFGLVGIVMLIVGLVRRRQAPPQFPTTVQ